MGCCSNFKCHGYFIGTLTGLGAVVSIVVSIYFYSAGGVGENSFLRNLVSTSYVGFIVEGLSIVGAALMMYGIYKENRYFLIPFIITFCIDWVYAFYKHVPSNGWLLKSAFSAAVIIYVYVVLYGLFVLFGKKIKPPKSDRVGGV